MNFKAYFLPSAMNSVISLFAILVYIVKWSQVCGKRTRKRPCRHKYWPFPWFSLIKHLSPCCKIVCNWAHCNILYFTLSFNTRFPTLDSIPLSTFWPGLIEQYDLYDWAWAFRWALGHNCASAWGKRKLDLSQQALVGWWNTLGQEKGKEAFGI